MKPKIFSILSLSILFALIGCGGHSSDDSTPTTALVRVVHASPDAPNVDVLVGTSSPLTNVAYFASGERTVTAGPTPIQVRPTGTTTNVISAVPDLAIGRLYTVLAAGPVATIAPLIVDDPDQGPGAGSARLRLVHASPSAGNVDIYITSPTATLSGPPTLANVAFRGVSAALTVASGSYRVRITPAGNASTVAIDTGTLTLASNSSTVAVALDKAGSGAPLTARVYSKSY